MSDILKKIAKLQRGAGTEKVKKSSTGDTAVQPKKNGGARPGSGRKPGGTALQKRIVKQVLAAHYDEEVEIEVKDAKTGKTVKVKKPRALAVMEKLYQVGMAGAGNDAALDRWLNRALGKPPQPLIGDEDEAPVAIDLGVDRMLDKAYGEDDDEG